MKIEVTNEIYNQIKKVISQFRTLEKIHICEEIRYGSNGRYNTTLEQTTLSIFYFEDYKNFNSYNLIYKITISEEDSEELLTKVKSKIEELYNTYKPSYSTNIEF